MSLEAVLYPILAGIASSYPNIAPEGADMPRITYQLIAGGDTPDYAGKGGGARYARIQIDVWSLSYAQARDLAEQARVGIYDGMIVGAITDNPSGFEVDTKLHRASFDINVWE